MENKEILRMIDAGEKFSEEQLEDMVFELEEETRYGENGRWTRRATTIIEIEGRFFKIKWEEPLTEMSGSPVFDFQPVEVIRKERIETKTVIDWIDKDKA